MIPLPAVTIILRECRKCGWRGPLTGFYKDSRNKFGRQHKCYPCYRKNRKERYHNDADWRKKKLQKDRELLKHKYHNDAEWRKKKLQRQKDRYNSDAEWRKQQLQKNREKSKHKYHHDAEYRKKILDNQKSRQLNGFNIKQLEDTICYYCQTEGKMTGDHIIPTSWMETKNVLKDVIKNPRNIVPACLSCNSSKRDRLPRHRNALRKIDRLLGYSHKEIDGLDLDKDFWNPPKETSSAA